MLFISCCCKDERNARHHFQSLHFHSKIPLRGVVHYCNFVFIFVFIVNFCISKENHYFLIYLPGKLQAASYPSRITFGTVMNEYSQSSQIFQLGRRFSITLDIILNEKSMHKVLDSSYAQERIRNVFLKYSQENRLLFLLWLGFVHKCFPSKYSSSSCVYIHIPTKKNTHWRVPSSLTSVVLASFWGDVLGVLKGDPVLFVSVCTHAWRSF